MRHSQEISLKGMHYSLQRSNQYRRHSAHRPKCTAVQEENKLWVSSLINSCLTTSKLAGFFHLPPTLVSGEKSSFLTLCVCKHRQQGMLSDGSLLYPLYPFYSCAAVWLCTWWLYNMQPYAQVFAQTPSVPSVPESLIMESLLFVASTQHVLVDKFCGKKATISSLYKSINCNTRL